MTDHTPNPPDSAPADHPTPKELAAYRGGALKEERAEEIRDHLAACEGDCVDWLLDLAELEGAQAPQPEESWEPQKLADWQALEKRLERSSETSPETSPWASLWPLAAAAMVLVSIALGAFLFSSQQQNRRLTASLEAQQKERARSLGELRAEAEAARRAVASANRRLGQAERQLAGLVAQVGADDPPILQPQDPQLFVPSADLFPENFVRSGGTDPAGSDVAQLAVPPGIDLFTVTLNLADPGAQSAYRLRILNAAGDVVWSGEGLKLTRFGNFSVVLSRTAFPDAAYRFEVDGKGADGWRTLQGYELRIIG